VEAMKKLHSVKMLAMLTVLAAGSVQARNDDCEGPLDCGRWYVMPKIGVAPGIFANRGYEHYVVPGAAVADNCTLPTSGPCRQVLSAPTNVFQQNSCKGLKFGQLWSNGVLHVGFELGHNTSDNGQCFLEFFYDRASGREVCYDLNNYKALAGCTSDDCNTNCSTFTGTALDTSKRTDCLDNYTAYGVYLGHRHYFNRIFCDRFAFFTGVKFGLQHRKAVNVNSTTPAFTESLLVPPATAPADYRFAERSLCNIYYCKSNAVSGSVQFGFDYCINDCLTAVMGVEVQATAPFKTNQNIEVAILNGTREGATAIDTASGILVAQPTNFIPASTGTFVQFPVWVGFRWEFDFCQSAC
jgi:hypothetical protein